MATLHTFLKAINSSKENVIDEDFLAEKEYLPFIVNRTLSYFVDSIAHAQEMNLRPHAENKLQFDYLLNAVRRRNRFTRWIKPEREEDIEHIKRYYNYSNQKAREAYGLLSEDELKVIREAYNTGGLRK